VNDTSPRVVDLYAGAGLFSRAFQQVGFKIVRAIELDPVAAETYAANIGPHIEVGDVSKIKPTGACDVLIAGPPCQGFSTLGKRQADDRRNDLSLEVVRWSRFLRPRIVVIENVTAFLDSHQWRQVARRLGRLDYTVTSFVLDAHDYGCAQHRRRSFTIAAQDEREFAAPNARKRVRSVREAWEGLSPRPDRRNHHFSPEPSPIALARMQVIPPGGDKRDVMQRAPNLTPPSWWRLSCEVTDAWGRMEWDKPCNTLRTALQNASKGRYIHPEQHRVISLREAARLHSIPDDWTFAGLPTQIARQIGNSVPPTLGRAVARMVLRRLND
jgi:DNA (cytosine-5)-methyltransferase 1